MLSNSYSLTYNAEALTLTRVNQDAYRSTYFGKISTDRDVTLEVSHTFPKDRTVPGVESHLVKITINYYSNTDGKLLRTERVWTVVETMQPGHHRLQELFEQLGLPSAPEAIDA